MNKKKNLKNCKNDEIINKIKLIFEEAIDYFIPKESQNIFLLLLKEITNINQEYFNNIKNLKDLNEDLKSKIKNYENKYSDLANKLKKKRKGICYFKKRS